MREHTSLFHLPRANQQRLLECLIDDAPIGIATLVGADHRFIFANPTFAVLVAGQQLVGHTYAEVFPDLAEMHLPLLRQVCEQSSAVTIDDVALPIERDGERQESHWRFRFLPYHGEAGERLGVQCYCVETTRTVAEQLADQEKDVFLSVASHELRTPLTILKGLLQMAQRRLASGQDLTKARDNLTIAGQQIVRMEELINKLFDITRITNGELPLAIERCDLADLVRAAVLRAQAMTDRHTVRLKGDQHRLPLDADPPKIEQVLNNLLWNAVKFTPNGGEILVTIEIDGDCVIVRVSDSGIGIPSEGRERLFERFYRGPNAPSQHFSGLGIGLYLSSQIAQRHNGRLWLEATGSFGSVFALALPLVPGTVCEPPR